MEQNKIIKIGINGLGRIGRSIFNIALNHKNIEVTVINELNTNIDNIIYTLNYDSTYGVNPNKLLRKKNKIHDPRNKKDTTVFNVPDIANVPWKKYEIDFLIDSSGIKANQEKFNLKEFKNFIIVQTNSDNKKINHFVHGVNEFNFKSKDRYISSSICDSVALSPLLFILNKYLIQSGSITTVHPLLNYQTALDSKSASWSVPGATYGHFELGRSFINNVIPKPTSALNAVQKVLGEKNIKKINSFSYRIPTTIVGSADLCVIVKKKITKTELINDINILNKKYDKEIIKLSKERLTSIDYIKNENNCILDLRWTYFQTFGKIH